MKALTAGNYLVRPFVTHKTQLFSYSHLGEGNPDQISVDLAVATPTGSWTFDPTTGHEPQNPDGIYSRPLYSSVRTLFYGSGSEVLSSSTGSNGWYPTGSEVYVINVAQSAYGEGMVPGSFSVSNGIWNFIDNGSGQLVNQQDQNGVVGNIFYGLGVAVIQKASFLFGSDGLYLVTGSILAVQFDATHTIYEHTAYCTMESGEFNYSLNPSMTATGSAWGEPIKVLDRFASGSLTPYFTTIGLYSDQGELVAVAKVPRPLKRAVESQQTVVVRFDI